MKNITYDRLKTFALVFPIFITLIGAIMKIWNIPYAIEVGLTLDAIEAFIAGLVKISNTIYNKKKEK